MRRLVATCLLFLAILPPAALCADVTDIPELDRAPALDGDIQSVEWSRAFSFADFAETNPRIGGDEIPPAQATHAWLGVTADHLWLAFHCRHDDMSQLSTAAVVQDGAVYADDSVELFLRAHGESPGYYHVIANSAGVVYDAYNAMPRRADTGWDSGCRAAGRILEDGFSIEIAIPLTAFNLGLNPSGRVGVNLCRNTRYTVGRQSAFGAYHEPTTWKTLRLPGTGPVRYPVAIEGLVWSPLAGENVLGGTLRNLTDREIEVRGALTVTQEGQSTQTGEAAWTIAGGAAADIGMVYSMTDKNLASLVLSLRDAAGREIAVAPRTLKPKPIVTISLDSDVLLRGENPVMTLLLNVPRAALPGYEIVLTAKSADGREIFRRSVSPERVRRLQAEIDLSRAPPGTDTVTVETVVINRKEARPVFRTETPLRIVSSAWDQPDKEFS